MDLSCKINKYINEKKELQNSFLQLIDSSINWEIDFHFFIEFAEKQKYEENKEEFKHFLHFLINVSNNYHRELDFIPKIEKVLQYFSPLIKQTFSNIEMFYFFLKSRQILLFLFNTKIITIDQHIFDIIIQKNNGKSHFFYPQIKSFAGNDKKINEIKSELLNINSDIFDNFEEKQRIGENDLYICSLIRSDSVEDFITLINKKNINLESTIKTSIFETNLFLIEKKSSSLMEYSTFFGSIQIFNYLKLNGVELTPSLWLYAIHGKNSEIIHILEEMHIEPIDKTYEECFKESIKCHHNDIANYIDLNLLTKKSEYDYISYGFHYYNYNFIPSNLADNKYYLYFMCKYGYYELIKILILTYDINVDIFVIFNFYFIEIKNIYIYNTN